MSSSEQRTSHRRPFRVFCCLVTTLSFVIIVPTLCIALGIILRPRGELYYTRSVQDETNTDRMVRLIPWSGIIHNSSNWKISLRANLVSADIRKTTMIVEWYIDYDSCVCNCTKVTIFFDAWVVSSETLEDYNILIIPLQISISIRQSGSRSIQ